MMSTWFLVRLGGVTVICALLTGFTTAASWCKPLNLDATLLYVAADDSLGRVYAWSIGTISSVSFRFLDCCVSRVSIRFRRGGNDYVLSLRVFDMLDTIASARDPVSASVLGVFFFFFSVCIYASFRDKGRAGVRMFCLFVCSAWF
jgi:hypothetical protein